MYDKPKPTAGETVKKYGRQLFNFIKGKTNSTEDAEDILQDVWYQLARLTNLDELENISAWLYTISRNKITDLYRKRKPESLDNFYSEDEEGNRIISELLLMDTTTNPELALFKDQFWQALEDALNVLPPKQKLVFIENELNDKTLQQIATEQNEPLKTIISRKGYAMKIVRERLLPLYNDLIN